MVQLPLILAIFIHSGLTQHTYRAAVLEHHPLSGDTPESTILKNLKSYRNHAKEAKAQNADIIVFPEYGLTTVSALNNITQYTVPVNHNNRVIKELRSIARENRIYLVANLFEETPGSEYYNTNLVFDRRGNIILRYHKTHPVGEPGISAGAEDQNLKFDTDFGVTFGIFTCFDILWENPARRVLESADITDVIYPAAWSASVPFHMPLSIQHGYSLANGVNFLAASYNDPLDGLGGSGIYLGNGQIAESYISDVPRSALLVQDVPKMSRREDRTKCVIDNVTKMTPNVDIGETNNFYVFDDESNRTLFKHENLNLSKEFSSHEICDKDFCCTFDIHIDKRESSSSEFYKLVAYNHRFTLDEDTYFMRICSLLLCEDDDVESCGTRLNSSVKFEKITVKGRVERDGWTQFMPITLNYYFQPIVDTVYCVSHEAADSVIELTTTRPQRDVLVFGIKGTLMSRASLGTFGTVLVMILAVVDSIVA